MLQQRWASPPARPPTTFSFSIGVKNKSHRCLSFLHFDIFIYYSIHTPLMIKMMRFSLAAVFALTKGSASAWSSPSALQSKIGFGRCAPSLYRSFAALHSFTVDQAGEVGTDSFRLFFKGEGSASVSPWHDVPLKEGEHYNMLTEIPKMTKAKMEIATKQEHNPIAQDVKKGKLRDYHGPIFWNYGCLPQTWEDPNEEHPELKVNGDNDPVDVVEIGSSALPMGSITKVKPLGVLAMIDDGELDWKVLAISVDDPLATQYNDIDDVPAAIKDGVREWFRWYKTPDDKPLNEFGFGEKFLNAAEAKKVIAETNESWKKLRSGAAKAGKLWTGVTADVK